MRYSVVGDQTAGAAASIVSIGNSGVTFSAELYELIVSSITTAPADANIRFRVKRTTALGAGTAVTPEPLGNDPNDDRPAITSGLSNHTSEPTYAGVAFLDFGMNQRNTFRWIARPGGEILITAAKNNGLGCQCVSISAGTPELAATMHFEE